MITQNKTVTGYDERSVEYSEKTDAWCKTETETAYVW